MSCLQRMSRTPASSPIRAVLDLVADQEPWVTEIRRYGFFQLDVDPSVELDHADKLQEKLFASQAYKDSVDALVAAIKEKGLPAGQSASTRWASHRNAWNSSSRRCRMRNSSTASRCSNAYVRSRHRERSRYCGMLLAVTERAIDAALAVAAEGVTERELLREFNACLAKNDAAPVVGCIGFGNRSAMINVQPSDRTTQARRSDPLRRRRPLPALSLRHVARRKSRGACLRRSPNIIERSKREYCGDMTSSSRA